MQQPPGQVPTGLPVPPQCLKPGFRVLGCSRQLCAAHCREEEQRGGTKCPAGGMHRWRPSTTQQVEPPPPQQAAARAAAEAATAQAGGPGQPAGLTNMQGDPEVPAPVLQAPPSTSTSGFHMAPQPLGSGPAEAVGGGGGVSHVWASLQVRGREAIKGRGGGMWASPQVRGTGAREQVGGGGGGIAGKAGLGERG